MKQEKVAGKVLMEMLDRKIFDEMFDREVWYYLMMVFSAGFDEGRRFRANKKPVIQLSLTGDYINMFDSAAEAARSTGIQHSEIARCASGKKRDSGWGALTAGGFKWKYVNKEKDGKSDDSRIGDATGTK